MSGRSTIEDALRELRQQRERIDAAIAALEALISGQAPVAAETSAAAKVLTGEAATRRMPSSVWKTKAKDLPNRTAAVERLFHEQPDRIWTAPELAAACGDDETNRELMKSYYSILRRLADREIVDRYERGRYSLKDTSTPVAPGVEVSGESEREGSPLEKGGRDEVSIPHGDRGDALV